jgi:hypothetical protein
MCPRRGQACSVPLSRLAAAALTGILLTLASAWIPAAFLDISGGKLHPLDYEHPPAQTPSYIDVPKDWHLRTWHACWGPGLRYDLISECEWAGSTIGSSPSTAPNRTLNRITTGFPFPCMQWATYSDSAVPKTAKDSIWYLGLDLPGKGMIGERFERHLPLRPVLAPFIANAAIYAAASFLLLSALAAIRQSRRRARGLCPHCGYGVAGLPRCPECGTQLAPSGPQPRPT